MDHKKENHAALMGILAELAEGIKEKIDHGIETPMTRIEQYILLEAVLSFSQKMMDPAVAAADPIPMLLFCPSCGMQHVDEPHGDWTNPPHATHTCMRCGWLWRPSNHNITGVKIIEALEEKHLERIANSWPPRRTLIRLSPAEIQSGHDRVQWAEGLLQAMLAAHYPGGHDGIESWLLNYSLSDEWAKRRISRGVEWDSHTRSAKGYRS